MEFDYSHIRPHFLHFNFSTPIYRWIITFLWHINLFCFLVATYVCAIYTYDFSVCKLPCVQSTQFFVVCANYHVRKFKLNFFVCMQITLCAIYSKNIAQFLKVCIDYIRPRKQCNQRFLISSSIFALHFEITLHNCPVFTESRKTKQLLSSRLQPGELFKICRLTIDLAGHVA